MGLKSELIRAFEKAALESGMSKPDTSKNSFIERLAHHQTKAIGDLLLNSNFTITKLNAPIVVEEIKTPPLPLDLDLKTLLGDKAPILDTIKQIPGGSALVAPLEQKLKEAIQPLLQEAGKVQALLLNKANGALQSTGYVFIGEDPDSKEEFNVDDEDGQREYTSVKIIKTDLDKLL